MNEAIGKGEHGICYYGGSCYDRREVVVVVTMWRWSGGDDMLGSMKKRYRSKNVDHCTRFRLNSG